MCLTIFVACWGGVKQVASRPHILAKFDLDILFSAAMLLIVFYIVVLYTVNIFSLLNLVVHLNDNDKIPNAL